MQIGKSTNVRGASCRKRGCFCVNPHTPTVFQLFRIRTSWKTRKNAVKWRSVWGELKEVRKCVVVFPFSRNNILSFALHNQAVVIKLWPAATNPNKHAAVQKRGKTCVRQIPDWLEDSKFDLIGYRIDRSETTTRKLLLSTRKPL